MKDGAKELDAAKTTTEEFARIRQRQTFDALAPQIQQILQERQLQPFPRGGNVDEVLGEIERLERLAENGWQEDELRLRVLEREFEKKRSETDKALDLKAGETARFAYLHAERARGGKGGSETRQAAARRAIDAYYKRNDWENEQLVAVTKRMLIWTYLFGEQGNYRPLSLEIAAGVKAACGSRQWLEMIRVDSSSLAERNEIADLLIDRIHQIADLPRPWVLWNGAELECSFHVWCRAHVLLDAINRVYRQRSTLEEAR